MQKKGISLVSKRTPNYFWNDISEKVKDEVATASIIFLRDLLELIRKTTINVVQKYVEEKFDINDK